MWNPVTGERKFADAYEEKDGRTIVPLDFAPCGSWFVVFREPKSAHPAIAKSNTPELQTVQEISGAWTVHFDPKWGGPETAQFDSLVSWPTRAEPGIKFYSGTATYEKNFNLPDAKLKTQNSKLFLDLGSVRELAEVKVNGKVCGIVWCPPWRVDIDGRGESRRKQTGKSRSSTSGRTASSATPACQRNSVSRTRTSASSRPRRRWNRRGCSGRSQLKLKIVKSNRMDSYCFAKERYAGVGVDVEQAQPAKAAKMWTELKNEIQSVGGIFPRQIPKPIRRQKYDPDNLSDKGASDVAD